MLITEFKSGDLITRTEPAKGYIEDKSWIGDKLEFVSLKDGKLNFKNHTMGYQYTKFDLDRFGFWWMGWDYFSEASIRPLLDDAVEKKMLGLIDRYNKSLREINQPLRTELYIVN